MFGSNSFSFETPNVIDVGDLPPSPPTRLTSNGTGTTASLSSSSSSNTTTTTTPMPDTATTNTTTTTSNNNATDMEEVDVNFHHSARASATRLLNDIRDLEIQSQSMQLPLPRSTIQHSTSTSTSTSIPLSQRLPFRDFPSRRSAAKVKAANSNEMYDPYMDEDEEAEDTEENAAKHSLPTSGEALRMNLPYHQNRMGRTMKLSAPSFSRKKQSATKHNGNTGSSATRSLFRRTKHNENDDDDVQNLYSDSPDEVHSRNQYIRAILEEMWYYTKLYRNRIVVVIVGLVVILTVTITTMHHHHSNQKLHSLDIPNYAGSDRYQQIVQYLTQQKQITSLEDITADGSNSGSTTTTRTPQNRALNWIVGIDALQYDTTNPHLVQRYVLAVLYFSTGGRLIPVDTTTTRSTGTSQGDTDTSSSWTVSYNFMNGDVNECQWSSVVAVPTFTNQIVNMGVSCNSNNQDVTTIFLPNNQLEGTLPSEIGFLSALTLFGLQDNHIVGTLPETLQNWNAILYFNMNNNQLTSTIPDYIGNWNNIEVIGLEHNTMTGTIPASFGTASRLVTIALTSNQFSGTLELLRHLAQIEYLYVSHNQFTGIIEEEFFYNMKSLREIDLSHNGFHGNFPTQMLLRGSNLHTIDVAHNNFTGTFPHEVTTANYVLHYLNIRNNQISGTIPETINRLSVLRHLDVTDNRITGSIPHAIGKCESLEYLFLGNNPYTLIDESDDLPPLSDLDQLRELSFTGLNVTGPIPTWIHFLTQLEMLDLSYNHFYGTIPTKVWSLPRLYYLILNNNINITGPLPTSGGTQLSVLSVHHTNLHDSKFDTAVCKNNIYNQVSVETGGPGILVFADCQSGCTSSCCNDCCDENDDSDGEACGAAVIASYTDGIDHMAAPFAFDPSVLSEAQVFDEENEPIENP